MFCLSPLRERLPACPVAQRCRRRLDHLGGGLSAPRPSCPPLPLTRSLLRQAAYCDPGLISEVGTFKPEQKPTSSISLLIALRLISCAASFDEQVRAPLHLDAPRWRKPLQQDARAQSLKMGAGAIFKDWVRVLTLSRARAGSTSPTRSAGRSLPTSRCARPPPALPVFALLTRLHSPADQLGLRCLFEDGRARKVRARTFVGQWGPPPPHPPMPFRARRCTHKLAEVWNHEAFGKASTSFTHPFTHPPRRCRAGCRPTRWRL